MKIRAKARDYKNDKAIFFGVYRDVDVDDIEDAFIDGAQWMQSELIDKAVEWFKHQKEEIGISWFDDFEIRFRKAMKNYFKRTLGNGFER